MKECPYCKFENFSQQNYCEKCEKSLFRVPQERFHFAEFLRKNYQLYSVIGIFIALSYYLVSLKNSDLNFAIFILVIAGFYLIIYLIQKGGKIVKSNFREKDQHFDNLLSFIHYYFFFLFHFLLMASMVYYIPENLRLYIAILVGFVVVTFTHLQTISKGYKPDLSIITPSTFFLCEIILFLIILIPFLGSNVNNETFAFYYLWSIPVLQFFLIGMTLANIFGYLMSEFISQSKGKLLQLQPLSDEKLLKISLLWGIVTLIAIILTSILWDFFI